MQESKSDNEQSSLPEIISQTQYLMSTFNQNYVPGPLDYNAALFSLRGIFEKLLTHQSQGFPVNITDIRNYLTHDSYAATPEMLADFIKKVLPTFKQVLIGYRDKNQLQNKVAECRNLLKNSTLYTSLESAQNSRGFNKDTYPIRVTMAKDAIKELEAKKEELEAKKASSEWTKEKEKELEELEKELEIAHQKQEALSSELGAATINAEARLEYMLKQATLFLSALKPGGDEAASFCFETYADTYDKLCLKHMHPAAMATKITAIRDAIRAAINKKGETENAGLLTDRGTIAHKSKIMMDALNKRSGLFQKCIIPTLKNLLGKENLAEEKSSQGSMDNLMDKIDSEKAMEREKELQMAMELEKHRAIVLARLGSMPELNLASGKKAKTEDGPVSTGNAPTTSSVKKDSSQAASETDNVESASQSSSFTP